MSKTSTFGKIGGKVFQNYKTIQVIARAMQFGKEQLCDMDSKMSLKVWRMEGNKEEIK